MTTAPRGALAVLSGHTFVYLLGSLLAKVASLLLLPIFTPLLTLEEYGVLEIADTTLSLLLQLASFQLDAALARFYLGAADQEGRRRVAGTAFLAVAGSSLLAALPLFVFARPLADVILDDPDLATVFRWTAAILVAMVLAEVPLALLKAERRSVAATGWQIVRLIAELALKIVFVAWLGWGVLGVLRGQALAGLAFLAGAGIWFVARHGSSRSGWSLAFDRGVLRSMIAYSAPMVAAGLCQFALHSSDRYLFRAFSTLDELGLYGVGYKLGYAPVGVALSAFLLVWYPYVFTLRDPADRARLIGRACVLVPALLTAVTLPVALLAPEIVRLLTDEEFHAAWPIVPVVGFAYLLWTLFQIVQTPFYVHARTRELPRIVIVATVANLAANFLLLPRLGGMGAALATVLALALLALLARRAAQAIEPSQVAWTRVATLLAPCAAAAIALYALPADSGMSLPVRLGVLVVSLAWLLLGFASRDEREEFRRMLRSFG